MSIPRTIAQVAFTPKGEADRYLPESPRIVQVDGRAALCWINIQTGPNATTGSVHIGFLDNGERRRFGLPARPGFILPCEIPNTLVVGLEKTIGMLNLARGAWTPLAKITDTRARTIINDGEVLPGGHGIVFGTKDVSFLESIAHLYLMTLPDQQISVLADDMLCSNGKILLNLGQDAILFDIDTAKKLVERYYLDVGKHQLIRDGIAIDLRDDPAFPDGMVDCGDGSVIIAFYNPNCGGDGVARRYRLSGGELVEEWIIPGSPRVTCPLLFKHQDQIKVLFTTAVEGMPADMRATSPNAGALFIASTTLTSIPDVDVVRLT
ncbi:SMP-30/gluconolactonase/LRE family protein [soil metagenome]